MKQFIVTAVLTIMLLSSGRAQCDSFYVFCTQGEIDSFQIKYGPCTDVHSISLSYDCEYTNIDSLRNIRRIEVMSMDGRNGSKLVSLSGFDSLEFIGSLIYSLPTMFTDPLPSLDTILVLQHTFNGNSRDLKLYQNVRYMERLTLLDDGSLIGLDNLNHKANFELSVSRNSQLNNINEILDFDVSSFSGLVLDRSSNIDLNGFEKYDSIRSFGLFGSSDIDLTPLNNVKITNSLYVQDADGSINFNGGFKGAKELDYLRIRRTDVSNISEIVPALERVNYTMEIRDNSSLNDVSHISSFPPQTPKVLRPFESYLRITGNPNLEVCTNHYICDMIERFPDSIRISSNGAFCNYDYLNDTGCESLSTFSSNNVKTLVVYPNPASTEIILELNFDSYSIHDIIGRTVAKGIPVDQKVNVSGLKSGYYLISLRKGEEISVGRFVKE